jgi:hypothetical protein
LGNSSGWKSFPERETETLFGKLVSPEEAEKRIQENSKKSVLILEKISFMFETKLFSHVGKSEGNKKNLIFFGSITERL